MAKILNQTQLRQQNSLQDYGLKVEGLVSLIKFLEKLDLNELDIRYPVFVPSFFAIPVGTSLDNQDLRIAYGELTQGYEAPKIILARSSDPEERPGKFETHPSLFDPTNPKKSFENWLKAAQRVRDSGARALIGQPMIGNLEEFEYDLDYENYDCDKSHWQNALKVKSFGGNSSSFFGRSYSFIRGHYPNLVICAGLGSKIARGDKDVAIAQEGKWRSDIIQLNHNYRSESFSKCNQETIDLVTFENPDKFTSLRFNKECQFFSYFLENAQLPLSGYLFRNEDYYGFSIHHLFEIIVKLSQSIGRHVEIEGSVDEEGIHLFQLRPYDVPQRRFQTLTEVPESALIKKFERESLGFDQLRGDLVLSNDLLDYEDGTIFGYLGHVQDLEDKDLRYKQFIFPMARCGGLYEAAHSFGYTAQVLTDLEKKGLRSIAIGGLERLPWDIQKSDRVVKINDRTTRLRDVTVECDGVEAQIYFNN